MGVDGQRHSLASLPQGTRLDALCIGDWVGPRPVWTGAENFAPISICFIPSHVLSLSTFIRILFLYLFCPGFCFCLYCTIYTTQTSMPTAGFEPAIPASEWPQTLAIDCSTTGIGFRFPYRPVRSESLYRLSYTGSQWADTVDIISRLSKLIFLSSHFVADISCKENMLRMRKRCGKLKAEEFLSLLSTLFCARHEPLLANFQYPVFDGAGIPQTRFEPRTSS